MNLIDEFGQVGVKALTYALGTMMSQISEDAYRAGWYMGMEDTLPAEARKRMEQWNDEPLPREKTLYGISGEQAELLCTIADMLGHWAVPARGEVGWYGYKPYYPKCGEPATGGRKVVSEQWEIHDLTDEMERIVISYQFGTASIPSRGPTAGQSVSIEFSFYSNEVQPLEMDTDRIPAMIELLQKAHDEATRLRLVQKALMPEPAPGEASDHA